MRHSLKWVKLARVGIASIFIAVLTVAFVDFRQILPNGIARLFAAVQFVPSVVTLVAGASLSLACVGILALTLLFGRVYCSTICPLGVLQDVIARVAAVFRRKKTFLRYAPSHTLIRQIFFWGVITTIPTGSAGLAVAWLDPYSHFGRIMSLLVRPLILLGNNALVPVAEKMGWTSFYHVNVIWGGMPLLTLVTGFFLILIVMAGLRERLYCNTICPVGTLLGFLSARSFFKFKIDLDACGKCANCLKSCKAQCIDLKAGTIDASRCVACFNCLDSCENEAMLFSPDWKFSPPKTKAKDTFDPNRRALLLGTAGTILAAGAWSIPSALRAAPGTHAGRRLGGKFPHVVTPPTARDVDSFLARCTACQLCVSECITSVLQPSIFEYSAFDFLKPRMDFSRSFCNYDCHRCLEVCPTGALIDLPILQKQVTQVGVSRFKKKHCIVEIKGTACGACSEHCPTKAVNTVPYRNGLLLPQVREELCIGCGACEYACPAKPKAIVVEGLEQHGIARREHEAKAVNPSIQDGFPF